MSSAFEVTPIELVRVGSPASNDSRGPRSSTDGSLQRRYRHNPYSLIQSCRYYREFQVTLAEPDSASSASVTPRSIVTPLSFSAAPLGTRHLDLWGRVSFVPYPDEEFVAPSLDASLEKKGELVRVFLGQLPYFVTDMQLSWLCYTFGLGNAVALPERIMKKQPNGERLPTGCIHAYTTIRAVEEMAAGMHKRMLVDDTGVWHARSDMELDALSSYVACMKSDRTKRVPGRPYDTVVVQLATSTFVPMNPTPLTEFPTEFRFPHGGNKLLRGSPPPPSYDSTVTHILAPPPPYNPYTA